MEKEDLKELYLKWFKTEKKAEELRKALNNLEKIAKKFTNEEITVSCSMFDGVYIIWEDFDIWGLTTLYSPQDFINACENRGKNVLYSSKHLQDCINYFDNGGTK